MFRSLYSFKNYALLGLLMLILLVSQAYIQMNLNNSSNYSRLLNLSGRQRMLTQKIYSLTQQYLQTTDDAGKKEVVSELTSTFNTLSNSHQFIIGELERINALKTELAEVKNKYPKLKTAVELFCDSPGDSTAKQLQRAMTDEIRYLELMDSFTNTLEKYVSDEMKRFSVIQYLLLFATLVLIILEIFLVIRPGILNQKKQQHLLHNLAMMADQIEDYGLITLNQSGIIVNCNRGAEKIHGYNRNEMIGKSNKIFYPEEEKESGYPEKTLEEAKQYKKIEREGWRIRKDGSKFWAHISINTIYDENDIFVGFGKVTRDMTKSKLAEQAKHLEIKNKELEQFTYIASHDLKEPLRTIINYIQVIEEDFPDKEEVPEQLHAYLTSIKNAATRMHNLIHGVLDYSLLGKNAVPEKTNLNVLLKTILKDLEGAILHCNAEITIDPLPEITCYSLEMRLLFQNLISNAIKFRKKSVRPQINITCRPQSNGWLFSVRDNGIGIPENQSNKIFNIFRRATHKEEYEGQGIGLAHCKKIVEMHEGQIWFESEAGRGSTFMFTILT